MWLIRCRVVMASCWIFSASSCASSFCSSAMHRGQFLQDLGLGDGFGGLGLKIKVAQLLDAAANERIAFRVGLHLFHDLRIGDQLDLVFQQDFQDGRLGLGGDAQHEFGRDTSGSG